MRVLILILSLLIALTLPTSNAVEFADPDFTQETIPRPDGRIWDGLIGVQFDETGTRAFAWERRGVIWIIDEADPVRTPFLDINDEVLAWRDLGMVGFTLDPEFGETGHIYISYVVDRYHLEHCVEPSSGTGRPQCDQDYDPTQSIEATRATIGRIVRYTAVKPSGEDSYQNARVVDYDSRKVLVGETPQTGLPNLHQSHASGELVFGTDGTLLAAYGDVASFDSTDVGRNDDTAYQEALDEGIIQPYEAVGAYRSQLVNSLTGKILRLDPATGDGIPSNPFFNAANPRAHESRVWALGLRNPYRMLLRPDTGSHDPDDGDPGTLFFGDVGLSTWDEFGVVDGPGLNFGWPAYEGMFETERYFVRAPANIEASELLGCTVLFTDLIKQDSDPEPSFPNPCGDGNIDNYWTFKHTRPILDFKHEFTAKGDSRGEDPNARYPAFDQDGNAIGVLVGEPIPGTGTVGTEGEPFWGNASTAGAWYQGNDFPETYQNTYFHGDYGAGWIKNFVMDEQNRVLEVRDFLDQGEDRARVTYVATNPVSGGLYYVHFGTRLHKVIYAPGGNRPPTARADASINYGPSPLDVDFSSDESSDPEGGVLSSRWNFGDGSATGTGTFTSHTFTAANDDPTSYDVTLTVTDPGGQSDQAGLLISLNNTPPQVQITSPADGTRYPLIGNQIYNLRANISDDEHANSELTCGWQTILHHNNHIHEDPVDRRCSTQVEIPSVGCDGETYFFQIHLKVEDPEGLVGSDVVSLYPDCGSISPPQAGDDDATVALGNSVTINVSDNDSAEAGLDLDSIQVTSQPNRGNLSVGFGTVTYTPGGTTAGSDAFNYTINDVNGYPSNAARVRLTITSDGELPTVATPEISPPGGEYGNTVRIQLSTATADANIRYTLDGSEPNSSSSLYSAPIELAPDSNVTVSAKAFRNNWFDSATASATYVVSSGADSFPTSGLVGYWPLDDGSGNAITDASGNGHNGTLDGPQWDQGRYGGGLRFDGTDDQALIPHADSMAFTADDSYALAMWVNPAETETGTSGVVTKSASLGDWYGLWVANWGRWVYGGTPLFSGSFYTPGWHQVTLVQNAATGTRYLYVDGELTRTGDAVDADGPGDLVFGNATGFDEYFEGSLDEVRLYNRALSLGEIQRLATEGPAGNLAPVANDDSLTGPVGGLIRIQVLANDNDDVGLDPASVEIVDAPTEGNIVAIDEQTGEISYQHQGNNEGSDSFTYRVSDGLGLSSNLATVSLTLADYVPPTVTITAPTEGETVPSNLVVRWQRSGDDSAYDHIHVQLDEDGVVMLHDLTVNEYSFDDVEPGAHQVRVWLVDPSHQSLPNPEASDTVNFIVSATATASLTLLAPQQDERLSGEVEARWSTQGSFDQVLLQLDQSAPLAFRTGNSYQFTQVSEGEHQLAAWLVDDAGQELAGTRRSVTFRVESQSGSGGGSSSGGGGGGGGSLHWLSLLLLWQWQRHRRRS